MARYGITMMIEFSGELEAESREEAEELAWTSWSENHSQPITYDSVYSIEVQDLEDGEEW